MSAEPLNDPPVIGGVRWPAGTKAVCKHCGREIVYERPGDWYHMKPMALECAPIIREVDPDLERLLAEEEEIDRRYRAEAARHETQRLRAVLEVEEEITHVVVSLRQIERDLKADEEPS